MALFLNAQHSYKQLLISLATVPTRLSVLHQNLLHNNQKRTTYSLNRP